MKKLILLTAIIVAICQSSEARFEKYQWALGNRGEPQTIELDHITTYKVQARAGEDLKVPNLPLQSKKVIVAVLDTGFDFSHPAFNGRVVRKKSVIQAVGNSISNYLPVYFIWTTVVTFIFPLIFGFK